MEAKKVYVIVLLLTLLLVDEYMMGSEAKIRNKKSCKKKCAKTCKKYGAGKCKLRKCPCLNKRGAMPPPRPYQNNDDPQENNDVDSPGRDNLSNAQENNYDSPGAQENYDQNGGY
ncbi:hypothetical protein CASFOL_026777 [Castilleja foliolosa]|uniref:Uncharacterized protein n=1 Tax=Castilleja foliolosa TaxID=1961234 RepID=A0ABD3CI14_9LAMI